MLNKILKLIGLGKQIAESIPAPVQFSLISTKAERKLVQEILCDLKHNRHPKYISTVVRESSPVGQMIGCRGYNVAVTSASGLKELSIWK